MSEKSQATYVQKSMPAEVCTSKRVEEVPRTSVQRIAAAEGITVPLVWRIFHDQPLYQYHTQ
jgi:hypothetical protein